MSKIKKIVFVLSVILLVLVLVILGINGYIKSSTKNQIISVEESSKLEDIDCIIILGAGIWGDKPSPMLEDRLLQGIELYNNNVSTKIIMSGDHGREECIIVQGSSSPGRMGKPGIISKYF